MFVCRTYDIATSVYADARSQNADKKGGGVEEGGVSPPSRNYEFLRTRYVITTNPLMPLMPLLLDKEFHEK